MTWNPNSQSGDGISNNPYPASGNEKTKLRKLLLIAVGLFVAITVIALVAQFSQSRSGQDKNTKAATNAARKVTPNAEVRNVRVAGGFALAIVSDPASKSQANAGNVTVFKVNNDRSMTQIANGSSFSPIDYLEFGIPLATQAKLTGHDLTQVQRGLAGTCGYSGGKVPGYIGFDGSFNPGGWQIDAATLGSLEQALTATISNNVAAAKYGGEVVCVNATREKSNAATNPKTYVSTFTLKLQFITGNGTVTNHTFTFATGPNFYRSYTLDGQKIQPR